MHLLVFIFIFFTDGFMPNLSKFGILTTALLLSSGLLSAPAKSQDFTKEQIQQIVHEYIVEHPEILIEAGQMLQKKQAMLGAEKDKSYVKTFAKELFESPTDASVGPKTAKNVIVEFSDYNCGYCKRSKKLFFEVLSKHKDKGDIRYIFKEYPILGEGSIIAAKASLAVNMLYPDKFLDYHMAVINSTDRVTSPESVKPHVEKLGMDWGAVSAKMESKEVQDVIDKNQNVGMAMEVTGTPCYVINGKFVRGAPQTIDYIESQLK